MIVFLNKMLEHQMEKQKYRVLSAQEVWLWSDMFFAKQTDREEDTCYIVGPFDRTMNMYPMGCKVRLPVCLYGSTEERWPLLKYRGPEEARGTGHALSPAFGKPSGEGKAGHERFGMIELPVRSDAESMGNSKSGLPAFDVQVETQKTCVTCYAYRAECKWTCTHPVDGPALICLKCRNDVIDRAKALVGSKRRDRGKVKTHCIICRQRGLIVAWRKQYGNCRALFIVLTVKALVVGHVVEP